MEEKKQLFSTQRFVEFPTSKYLVVKTIQKKIKLVTSPAGKQLFDWDELAQLEVSSDNDLEEVDFRFVESEMGIQPDGLQVTLGYNHRHCFPI